MILYLIFIYLVAIGIAIEEYYQEETVSWYTIKNLFLSPILIPILFGVVLYQSAKKLDKEKNNDCKCNK